MKSSGIVSSGSFDMNRVLAKSDGKSLSQHILDCLLVYRSLCRALPALPIIAEQKGFFDLLFCSIYFHDWGKAHTEFQKVLRGKRSQWAHGRHEIYSAPFVDMLCLSAEDRELICQAILGHHKDFETLWSYLYSPQEIEDYGRNTGADINPLDFHANLLQKMDVGYLLQLKQVFQKRYAKYGGGGAAIDFVPVEFATVEHPVSKYVKPVLQHSAEPDDKHYWRQMMMLGATKLCDHMGSAGIKEVVSLFPNSFDFLRQLDGRWYAHQKRCGEVEGSLFLTAPTGSGKTEAALNWIRSQLAKGHQGRFFYVLPYTASINAMHQRLVKDFESAGTQPWNTRYVGLLHGKLSQYLAQYFEDLADDPQESLLRLQKIKEAFRQMVHPIKVVTPFQILKHCYGVKGFEMGLTELAGAMLVFDEIHAYDMLTFAQIVSSVSWLSKHLKVRTMIMTATLPSFMLAELKKAMGESVMIRADTGLLEAFTRHRLTLVSGGILEQIPAIEERLQKGDRTIVVCNTVAGAQEVFLRLRKVVEKDEAVLLHSRFNARDRLAHEHTLADQRVRLLVGTQAIEVSLDIDFDVLFSEPAPLDALIQRFGRVNRKRRKGICPVYVCRKGGEYDGYIYPQHIVQETLRVLEGVSILREAELQQMLDEVYPDWLDRRKYLETREGFMDSLRRLKPFMAFKEEEKAFYEKFAGVSVMPASSRSEYEEHMSRFELVEAEQLFVPLSIGSFHKLLNEGLLERDVVLVSGGKKRREQHHWLAKCKYDPTIGLLQQEEIQVELSVGMF